MPPPSPRRPRSSGTTISASASSSTVSRVVRDAAVPLAGVRLRLAHGEDRTAAERGGDVGGVGKRSAPWPSRVPVPTIPGPTEQTTRRNPAPSPKRAPPHEVTHCASPSRHGATAIAISSRPRSSSVRTVSDSETGSAPPAPARMRRAAPASAGAHRRHLAVQRAAGRPAAPRAASAARPSSSVQRDCYLAGRVRQCHHVRALLRREPEPARQVRVEDVEAARAELEQPRLLVHEHVVAHLDLARQPRIRDAGDPVDLEPDQPGMRSVDGGDRPTPKADWHLGRHRPAPASPRPSRRGRPPRCARRRCGSPSSRSPD